jgi:hypothetical protein
MMLRNAVEGGSTRTAYPSYWNDPQVYDKEPAAVPEGNLSADAKERNRLALAARKAKKDGFLPDGWRRVS